MRVVGNQDRTEFILDPATHAELNRRDDLRSAEIARRLNRAG
ncbi:MAG TPA: hypothetical protein VFV90_13170 [Usitatibacter sp.]|nr:hypothetical protein [Usitatibacter sp.]